MQGTRITNPSIRPRENAATVLALLMIVSMCIAGCQRESSRFSDEQILDMMRRPKNLPYNYWHGESKWELTERGSSMLSWGHLEFGRIFTEENDWGVILREVYSSWASRLSEKPLLLVPLLDSKDPDVVLYALHCYEQRSNALEQHLFSDLKPLYDELVDLMTRYPDTRVRWKAFHLMTEMNWVSAGDLAHALDDPAESIRLAAASYLNHSSSRGRILPFEREIRGRQIKNNFESDIHNDLAELAIKHINDNHHNVRFRCAQALKSLIRKPELFDVQIANEPPDDTLDIDWMRESWWKRDIARKQLEQWWQENRHVG